MNEQDNCNAHWLFLISHARYTILQLFSFPFVKVGEAKREGACFRDKSAVGPPSSIPNLEVKRCSADGTTAARLWESRPSRDYPFFLFLSSFNSPS